MLETAVPPPCQADCKYGVPVASDTLCTCACFKNWIGDLCDTHTCFGQGTFSTTTERCDCRPGYIGDLCESRATPPTTSYTDLIQLNCPPGATGASCETICGTDAINGEACPFRWNWIHDGCYEDDGLVFCVCGGGYSWSDSRTLRIQTMACNGTMAACSLVFKENAARCCAPDTDCALVSVQCPPWDDACCYGRTGRDSCRNAGCAFLDSGVCTSIYHGRTVMRGWIYIPTAAEAVAFAWMQYTKTCAYDEPSSLCNRIIRNNYIAEYSKCYPSSRLNDTCLREIRDNIQLHPFPLASVNAYFSTTTFAAQSRASSLYLAPPLIPKTISVVPATWSPRPSPLQITSILRNERPCNVITYLVASATPAYYCLALCPHCTNAVALTDTALVWYNLLPFYPLSGSTLGDCYCTNPDPADPTDEKLVTTIPTGTLASISTKSDYSAPSNMLPFATCILMWIVFIVIYISQH